MTHVAVSDGVRYEGLQHTARDAGFGHPQVSKAGSPRDADVVARTASAEVKPHSRDAGCSGSYRNGVDTLYSQLDAETGVS